MKHVEQNHISFGDVVVVEIRKNSPLRVQNQSLHFLNDFPINAAYAIYENAYLDKLNVV